MTFALLLFGLTSPPVTVDNGAPAARPSPYNPIRPNAIARPVRLDPGPIVVADAGRSATPGGELHEPYFDTGSELRGEAVAYQPRPGDIVFFVSNSLVYKVLYKFALSGEPFHVGIVVRGKDGCLQILEAGPCTEDPHVRLQPYPDRLYEFPGRVFVRRRNCELTAEENELLTGFALRQEGKCYAGLRFLLHGTPLRCRGPIRTHFMGKPRGEPSTYFCSELVLEALVAAGLTDPETARPRATTPQDLFLDSSMNPYIDKHLKLAPDWGPPQRWIGATCPPGK